MEYIVVGCGISGAVVARELAEHGRKVQIWERRNHIGGNMLDEKDQYGILVHRYGPHIFHTKNPHVYEYVCRYGEWDAFHVVCGAEIDGKCTPTPFNFQTIDDYYTPEDAAELKKRIKACYGARQTATVVEVLENEDPMIRGYAEFLFAKDYSLYTAKQWGVSPSEIDPSILKRVPLRFSYDIGYFDDPYQMMPHVSYHAFFEKLLDHPGIIVKLGVEALDRLSVSEDATRMLIDGQEKNTTVIYTGALDELFGHCAGALPYRSLRFEWKHEMKDSLQDMPVVAYPQANGFTRITEYKKLPVQNVQGTTYALEYSLPYRTGERQEPYYPVLTEESQKQYARYQALARNILNLYCCGRLADFKYYNMDQAIERALQLSKELLQA